MKLIKIFTIIATIFMTACSAKATDQNLTVVSPQEFQKELNEDPNAYLLDVRQPQEYAAGHIKGARQLDWLDPAAFKAGAADLDKDRTIYVYCRSGRRSNEAGTYLAGQGFRVVDLDGGILGWEKAGLPVDL